MLCFGLAIYIKFKVLGFELAILICIKDLWKDLWKDFTESFCSAQLMYWPSLWKKAEGEISPSLLKPKELLWTYKEITL